jgi:hypothetical protein
MELKNFVAESLKNIIDGVAVAQEYAEKKNAIINPDHSSKIDGIPGFAQLADGDITFHYHQIIEFDVAVTTSSETEAKVGGGIFVAAASLGATGKDKQGDTVYSRIKFSIPIELPKQARK